MKLDDVKPPSISESDFSPDTVEPPKVDAPAASPTPVVNAEEPKEPPTITTVPPTPEPQQEAKTIEEPKPAEETKEPPKSQESNENKPATKSTAKNYNSNLSAPEVAQKYYVPRSRIATKNISFGKSKAKKPKYGRGSSPRNTGTSPHLSETEIDGERRQLPSRKSRPQQLLDDELVPSDDVLPVDHDPSALSPGVYILLLLTLHVEVTPGHVSF